MNRCRWMTTTVFLCSVFAIGSAHAHHSARAVYTDEDVEIEGAVTEFNFNNPHVNIILSVTDDNGEETSWMASGPAPTIWRRGGWTPDSLQVGQYVRLGGKMSRTGAPMLLLAFDSIGGGGVAVLDPLDGSVVGAIQETPNNNQRPDPSIQVALTLSDGAPNLTGTWVNGLPRGSGRGGPGGFTRPALSEEAATRGEGYDALDDPAFADCTNAILARLLISPLGVKITQHEDRVIFDYEHDGMQRVVYLDGREPATSEHTHLGHSVARYEGDALLIESSQLLGGLMVMGNLIFDLSDRTTISETYRRTDNAEFGTLLSSTMAVSDPVNLTEAWQMGWRKNFVAQYGFDEVDCRVPLPPAG